MSDAPIKKLEHETVTVGMTAAAISTKGVRSVSIEADDSNVGSIYLGGPGVTSANYGRKLGAGDVYDVGEADLSAIYAVADNAGDKLHLLEVL